MMIRTAAAATLLFGSLIAAAPADAEPAGFARDGYTPRAVTAGARPYHDIALQPRQATGTVDSTGVRMFAHPDITGGQLVNHPVGQAQYGLSLLNTHRRTGDPWFLDRAGRQAQRLLDTHIESRGAWWLPYPFDFTIGGHTVAAPWYSQMAQGQALSLFTRLHKVTGNPVWKAAADGVFASFLLPPSSTDPWGVWTDPAGYLWLEEYPRVPADQSERVLNGHLFALYGLWDYWNATRSADAAALFDGALTTVAHYGPAGFRNPGWASDYSLYNGDPHEKYHGIHVNQLHHLHALAGNARFANLGDTLLQDFPAPVQVGSLRLAATGHTGVKFGAGGTVTARKTVLLSSASGAPFDQRRRIAGQPGYWYRVTAGMLAGYWVQECRSVRAARAPVSAVPYFGARQVILQPGQHTAYTATGSKAVTVNTTSAAPVSRIGWLNARISVLVSAGSLSGYWLPLSSAVSLR